MAIDPGYQAQVQLLVRTLPIIAEDERFALKGGIAINLFVRDLPRLSVDIDLTWLPEGDREQALAECSDALDHIAKRLRHRINADVQKSVRQGNDLKLFVRDKNAQIKVELSPVMRGCAYPPGMRDIVAGAEDAFGFASIQVASLPDLYGGKICAALDRQHPRDWFDVMLLLEANEFTREVFVGFLVYLMSHNRPMNEVLAPKWPPLEAMFTAEFRGMTRAPVSTTGLEATRDRLMAAIARQLTAQDVEFLLSFKRGAPDWSLFELGHVQQLPAIRWKLRNIGRMEPDQHAAALARLEAALKDPVQR